MKSNKDFHTKGGETSREDAIRKAAKLDPIKKSGKERHAMYRSLDDEDDDEMLTDYKKRESVLDYFDDGEEDL